MKHGLKNLRAWILLWKNETSWESQVMGEEHYLVVCGLVQRATLGEDWFVDVGRNCLQG